MNPVNPVNPVAKVPPQAAKFKEVIKMLSTSKEIDRVDLINIDRIAYRILEPLFSCSSTTERDCNEPWRSLFVNFDGAVYPCPGSEILFKPKMDSRKYNSGNILTQHVMEFWNNGFWRVLRRTNAGRNRKEIVPECLCCGNFINWWGSRYEKAHILDWKEAKGCNLRI